MTPSIDIRVDLKPLHKAMAALGARQIPFATALTLNALAKGVVVEEKKAVDRTFDTPTPFTENAFRTEAATKTRPVAHVAVKDIQADYLRPYVIGGKRSLGTKKGMLAPIGDNVQLNAYGNLTKNKLKTLAAKPNVYIGPIVMRGGKRISGVWQRPTPKRGRAAKGPLKLLIKFADTTPVRKRFDFYGVAQRYVRANAASEFATALRRAMATQRR
ncbi:MULTISPECIES: hypothetical protein [Sphingomonas]|uniref:hypothetical protein n=1 Tax=Sphingomonas TaxID=13687 RepID=UPI000830CD09|nr:hypothetical protein [Sphingomonas sp. CCH10-B3]